MSIVYLNGAFLPEREAMVPVLDRGFIFGDGVYEVIPVFHGRLFRLAEHLRRFARSVAGVGIGMPLSDDGWRAMLEELLARNGAGSASVYLQVTRGVAPRDLIPPQPPAPTVFAMVMPARSGVPAPIDAVVLDDIRWQRCDLKVISLLPNVLLKQEALARGAADAILVRNGIVTEGVSSNVFAVVGDRLKTPAQTAYLLPGVTRDLVIELLAPELTVVHDEPLTVAELHGASEIFLSSSVRELAPVTRLDGVAVGAGVPGPVWRLAWQRYCAFRDG
ncbi:MAG: aminotransferase class IV [Gammaproteobacteria bacterium]|nr:aminotransferase class IV [Gammaproteobacteria bacterium]